MRRAKQWVVAALIVVGCLVVAAVSGAAAAGPDGMPKPGPWSGKTTPPGGKDDEAQFVVKGSQLLPLKIAAGWAGIVAPTNFKCNEAFLQLPIKHLIISHGRFSYHGKVVDTAGGRSTGVTGTLTWTGHFVSRTSVKGTVRLETAVTPVFESASYTFKLEPKPCDTGVLPWSGKAGRSLG